MAVTPKRSEAMDQREFHRQLRRLKKDFQKNVLPAVKRSRSHMSKGEMRRLKERKAERRLRRQMRRERRTTNGR